MLFGPVKAAFQVLCDDDEGAKETMITFSKTNPLIMPIRFTAEVVSGNSDKAEDTLKTFGKSVGNIACSTPVLGHTIAAGYGLAGKEEKAERIFKQATRTTVVAGAGILGSFAGPAGAAGLAIVAGTEWDLVDHLRGKGTNGVAKLIDSVAEGKKLAPGELFDTVMVPVGDGITGVAAAKTYDRISTARQQNRLRQEAREKNGPENTKQFEDLSKKIKQQGVDNPEKVSNSMCNKAKDLKKTVADNEQRLLETELKYNKRSRGDYHRSGHTSATIVDKHGNESTGYSRRLEDARGTTRFQSGESRLEKSNPSATAVNSRPLNACGEHIAYQNTSNPVITYAVQIQNGVVQCVERCGNCKQFDLGNVITDRMNGVPVPYLVTDVPPAGSYFGAAVSGIVLIDVAAKRNERRR